MEELARTTDRWKRSVTLRQRGWNHILERRRGVVVLQDDILATIRDPDRVAWDADNEHRENFYRIIADHEKPRPLVLKVCVEFGQSGGTITAHPLRRLKRTERQKWPP